LNLLDLLIALEEVGVTEIVPAAGRGAAPGIRYVPTGLVIPLPLQLEVVRQHDEPARPRHKVAPVVFHG